MTPLTNAKHERFAQEIAKGATTEDAYSYAGYSPSLKNAQRLKAREDIRDRIEGILREAAEKNGVTVERIVQEMATIAFADITEAVRWGEALPVARPGDDGEPTDEFLLIQGVELKPSADLPKRVTAAISEVRRTKEGIAIKFHDKNAALDKLARHLGMFKDKLEVSGQLTLAELVMQSYAPKPGGEEPK